jgi:hypothetical protein
MKQISRKVQEIYEPDLDSPQLQTFIGWVIKNGNNLFVIGDFTDADIEKYIDNNIKNVIICKDYTLANIKQKIK